MKKLVLPILAFLGFTCVSQAQVIVNSIADGNFSDPSTWDCNCVPSISNCDWFYVYHDVTLDQDLPNSPNIAIQPSASLIEDNQRSVSEVEILGNYGMLKVNRLSIGVNGGGQYTNYDSVFVEDLLIVDGNTLNNHAYTSIDDTFYLEEDVVFVNVGTGYMQTDVLLARGSLISHGKFDATRVIGLRKSDNTLGGTISNAGGDFMCDNMYCYAGFSTYQGGSTFVSDTLLGDSSNINIFDTSSVFVGSYFVSQNHVFATYEGLIVHGELFVDGDFYLDPNAAMTGSGSVCVTGVSISDGHIYATGPGTNDLDFCDLSGNGQFDFLNGTIDPTYITYCSASSTCAGNVSIEDHGNSQVDIFPNPASTTLQISGSTVNSYRIFDLHGKLISIGANETIDVSAFPAGLYFLEITDLDNQHSTKRFIKQ